MKRSLMLLALAFLSMQGQSQSYDLLIRNGRVIDPKNKIDAKMDIAVSDGKIAKVAPKIEGTAMYSTERRKTIT